MCIANSAYYAQSQKVNTISKAIVLLGINTIRNLVMVLSTSSALNRSFKGYGLEKGELYSHSIATAVGAGYIAKHTMTVEKEKIFIAGLLHDIGKMLLSPYLMDYIDTIKEITVKEDKPFNIVEKEIFGFNHCELGAELAIKWHLPKIVIEANKYHHDPSECPADDLPIIEYIHLADYIAYLSKYGLGIDGNNYKVIFDIFDKYKINDERKINLMKAVKNEMNELLKSIAVV